jgi:hypothetical protein
MNTMTPPMPPPSPGPLPPQRKKRGGCFLYGCLTVIILLVLFAAGSYFFLKSLLNRMVEQLGEDKPMAIQTVELAPNDFAQVRDRVQRFAEGVERGTSPEPLVLSAHDLNALITGHPGFQELKGRVFVDLQGSDALAQVSYPLDFLGYTGKYINAKVKGTFSFRTGVPNLVIKEAEFKGQKADQTLLSEMNRAPIADRFIRGNAETSDFFNKIESIEIRESRVVVRAR